MLGRGRARSSGRITQPALELLGPRGPGARAPIDSVSELAATVLEQAFGAFPPQRESLPRRLQSVQDGGCRLTPTRGVGELLLGLLPLPQRRLEPLRRTRSRQRRGSSLLLGGAYPRLARGQLESSKPRAHACGLAAQAFRTLGGGRLQRERPQTRGELALDVPGALDLDGDTRQLELGPVTLPLEAPEAGGLLDELASTLRARAENLLDPSLADDGVHLAGEAEIGEDVHDVEPADRGAVDQVLPLAASVESTGDGELRVGERTVPGLVVEDELHLAETGRRPLAAAGEEHVVGLLGAQLARAEAARGPDDRVRDVRLTGAVRADDDRDPGLETKLDRIREGLEPAELDLSQVHVGQIGRRGLGAGDGSAAEQRRSLTARGSIAAV